MYALDFQSEQKAQLERWKSRKRSERPPGASCASSERAYRMYALGFRTKQDGVVRKAGVQIPSGTRICQFPGDEAISGHMTGLLHCARNDGVGTLTVMCIWLQDAPRVQKLTRRI